MNRLMQAALLALALMMPAQAAERSPAQRAAFVRDNPCPGPDSTSYIPVGHPGGQESHGQRKELCGQCENAQ